MTLFISRDLEKDNSLRQQITAKGYELTALSLVEFDYVPFNYFPACHWIFFYSPRAVDYFLATADPLRYGMSRMAVIGAGTAKALITKGIVPDFIGNGNPEQTAESFESEAMEQRVLFPQAVNSRRSVESLIKDQVEVVPLVVYDNKPKQHFEVPNCDTLIFTSPLNVQAYLGKYAVTKNQRIIAIGKTTAGALRNNGILNIEITPSPNYQGILSLL